MASVLPIDEWLKPVSDQAPCGTVDDLALAQISAFDTLVKGAASDRLLLLGRVAAGLFRGGEITNLATAPDFAGKSTVQPIRHLKCALVLAVTALEDPEQGWPVFADALVLIQRLLTERWESVHPGRNDSDAEDPFIGRINTLNPLAIAPPAPAAQGGFVAAADSWQVFERMMRAPVLKSDRLGTATLRDCLSPWAGKLRIALPPGVDQTPAYVDEFRIAAGESLTSSQQAFETSLKAALSIQQAIERAPGVIKPSFDFLVQILRSASDILRGQVSISEPVAAVGSQPGPHAGGRPGVPGAPSGPITNRDEAKRRLAEVAEFFRRNEPSSPIPLLLERVVRLAGMNFLALLEELKLGDDAVPSFRALAGMVDSTPAASTGEEAAPK